MTMQCYDDDDDNDHNDDNDDGDNDEAAFARNETMTMECYDDAMIITTTMIMMAFMNMILQGVKKKTSHRRYPARGRLVR